MEDLILIGKIFGLGVLGGFLYAFATVWKKIQSEGFNGKKFFNHNKRFWFVCLIFNLLLAVTIALVPDFEIVLQALGFAASITTKGGYVLLGIALATGSDKTRVSGVKTFSGPGGEDPIDDDEKGGT